LNFILNYFFLSYFGLFELVFLLLWVVLNWLFLVSWQQSFGAASLAVIITQFYADDFAFGTRRRRCVLPSPADAVIAVKRTVSTTILFGWADRRRRLWR
jgi:hypothetical protein